MPWPKKWLRTPRCYCFFVVEAMTFFDLTPGIVGSSWFVAVLVHARHGDFNDLIPIGCFQKHPGGFKWFYMSRKQP